MIKNHAHAVEILSNCIPYFETVKSIDSNLETFIIFVWYGNKYMLDFSNCEVYQIVGHIHDYNSVTMLMTALIKKQIELNSIANG
jgi:hypothetical protein